MGWRMDRSAPDVRSVISSAEAGEVNRQVAAYSVRQDKYGRVRMRMLFSAIHSCNIHAPVNSGRIQQTVENREMNPL
jgi:hypothetical protein